ncbi:TPA: hypothetical protein MII55_27575 [Klebsiella pneumoniae]|nr:hypothetical protein [Klebsiella pneumoniae]
MRENIIGNACYIWLDMLKNDCIYPIIQRAIFTFLLRSLRRKREKIKRKFSHIKIKRKLFNN